MEAVFRALAEPTRRGLLARLLEDGDLSLTDLASPLAISRQAVTRHLEILREAGLVGIEWRGRERFHHLNPEPLKAVEEWLMPYSKAWDRRLDRLYQHLKENP
ncbi:MAG: metalloregulator ArsR/SmtB family transcription factor [Thermoanaerobaculia bacterium]|nr:metalloregulator ArsR/SmtB family transcription factor [Thermoanaerobaculia bacterium]